MGQTRRGICLDGWPRSLLTSKASAFQGPSVSIDREITPPMEDTSMSLLNVETLPEEEVEPPCVPSLGRMVDPSSSTNATTTISPLGSDRLSTPPPPVVAAPASRKPASVRPSLRVYSRSPRRRARRAQAKAGGCSLVMAPPTKAFICKMSKKVDGVLPRPQTNEKKKKVVSPSFIQRRSRRMAGIGVEPQLRLPAQRRAKMTVLRAMANSPIEAEAVFSSKGIHEYAKLFSKSLSDSQICALAALFGWSVPDSRGERSALEA